MSKGGRAPGRRVGFRKPLAARIDLASENRRVIYRSACTAIRNILGIRNASVSPSRPAEPCLLDL